LNDKIKCFFPLHPTLSWITHPWLEEHNPIEFNDEAGLAFFEAIPFVILA